MYHHLAQSYTIIDLVSVLPSQTAAMEGLENGQGPSGRVFFVERRQRSRG